MLLGPPCRIALQQCGAAVDLVHGGRATRSPEIYCNTCTARGYITSRCRSRCDLGSRGGDDENKNLRAAFPRTQHEENTLYLEAHYPTENRKQ